MQSRNDTQAVMKILAKCEAVVTGGHFVYTSGKHGDIYVNKDAIYPHTRMIAELCRRIAEQFAFIEYPPEVVIAPAIGGVILSQWVANYLSEMTRKEILSLYAEKADDGENFVVKRGYDKFIPEKRVLVVEDILNTGKTAKKVIALTRSIGGNVIGLGAICNRGGVTSTSVGSVRNLISLVNFSLDAVDETTCKLCAEGIPVNTDLGKGREFLKRKGIIQ